MSGSTSTDSRAAASGGRPRGRPPKGAGDELGPSIDYEEKMRALGPRPNEQVYTFELRMAALARARQLWIWAWREAGGKRSAASRLLGLSPNSAAYYMTEAGLTSDVLRRLVG